MKERMNEQVMNKIYIYYVWILSEWVDECPKIADGVNELVNIIQFILVTMHMIIKGLRPVLEGFVVPMHEGACETGSQIPRA